MRKLSMVLLLALATLAISGCDDDELLDLGVGVSGIVRNASNQDLLRDVTVTLQGRTRMTNELGIFVFTDLSAGRYTIRLEKSGFQTVTREIQIRDDFTNREN
ncbi:MAG TPA: carboxypeptidase-like regulatory domain-containing protein, partial [Thermoanaerobaculia bacterium]